MSVLYITIFFIALKLGIEWVLSSLNAKNVIETRDKIPEAYVEDMDYDTYQKSNDYTLEKNKFGKVELLWDSIYAILTLIFLLPQLYYYFQPIFGTSIWGQAGLVLVLTTILGLVGIPFELYSQFVIEEKFGFNKSSFKLWISDKLKGTAVGLVLGIPLLALLLKFFEALPDTWWFWGFIAFFSFQLLMMVLYPILILPLFNKLSPLPEGELKDRLMQLSERTGFKTQTIQVIDGSKRSGHSNAYFTGFGKFRRIVLYDTLIDQLTPEELEAVLAHEIGHYQMKHIPKMLAVTCVFMLSGFYLIHLLSGSPWFTQDFNLPSDQGIIPALLVFMIIAGYFTFWISPMMNFWSRKN
jgi:STE24 endopeptidase